MAMFPYPLPPLKSRPTTKKIKTRNTLFILALNKSHYISNKTPKTSSFPSLDPNQERMRKNTISSTPFLTLIITLYLTLQTPQTLARQTPSNPPNLIHTACIHSPSKHQCMQFLNSATPAQKTSLKNLAFFTLKLAEKDAVRTISHIKKVLSAPDLHPMADQTFTDCSNHYTSLVDLLEDAMDAAASGNFGDLEVLLDEAVGDVEGCRESRGTLDEGGIESSGMEDFELKAFQDLDVEVLGSLLETASSIAAAAAEH